MQGLLFVMMFLAAIFAPLSDGIKAIAILFFIGSIIAATHDVAIDGYYMEALDKDGQAKYIGYRVMAYRIAMMAGTGVIVTIGTKVNWSVAFLAAGVVFGLFFLYHIFFLKEVETEKVSMKTVFSRMAKKKTIFSALSLAVFVFGARYFFSSTYFQALKEIFIILGVRYLFPSHYFQAVKEILLFLKGVNFSHLTGLGLLLALSILAVFRKKIQSYLLREGDSYYGQAFISFMDREKMGIVLIFIILLRTGEWMLTTMVSPLIVDLGIKEHYGWIAALVGLPASIAGAMLGGWMISRFSIKRMIWPFILLQNLTNVVYMLLAFFLADFIALNTGVAEPVSIGSFNLMLVAIVQGFDQFAGGLGTAVLMTYLMRICVEKHKAAHYAIGSGLMSLSGLFAGVSSGFIAGAWGYSPLFGLSFLASVPAMMLIPFLPFLNDTRASGKLSISTGS